MSFLALRSPKNPRNKGQGFERARVTRGFPYGASAETQSFGTRALGKHFSPNRKPQMVVYTVNPANQLKRMFGYMVLGAEIKTLVVVTKLQFGHLPLRDPSERNSAFVLKLAEVGARKETPPWHACARAHTHTHTHTHHADCERADGRAGSPRKNLQGCAWGVWPRFAQWLCFLVQWRGLVVLGPAKFGGWRLSEQQLHELQWRLCVCEQLHHLGWLEWDLVSQLRRFGPRRVEKLGPGAMPSWMNSVTLTSLMWSAQALPLPGARGSRSDSRWFVLCLQQNSRGQRAWALCGGGVIAVEREPSNLCKTPEGVPSRSHWPREWWRRSPVIAGRCDNLDSCSIYKRSTVSILPPLCHVKDSEQICWQTSSEPWVRHDLDLAAWWLSPPRPVHGVCWSWVLDEVSPRRPLCQKKHKSIQQTATNHSQHIVAMSCSCL